MELKTKHIKYNDNGILSLKNYPTSFVLDLTDVKNYLKISYDDDDILIDMIIESAEMLAFEYLGYPVIKTICVAEFKGGYNMYKLPGLHHGSVLEVKDEAGVKDSSVYNIYGNSEKIVQVNDYIDNVLTIEYEMGFEKTPAPIKIAMLKHISSVYEDRENYVLGISMTELTENFEKILDKYKYYIL